VESALSESDHSHLRRALSLAIKGRGRVEPNPMVGCVIVKDGRVIGEGYHQQFGGPHAEPNALSACVESPRGATAHVTLEPCCHTNKKTPPCVPRLLEAQIGRVVIGALDPNPLVAGKGAAQLKAAGVQVEVLDLPTARQLIAPFIARTTFGRPYVTLKWAESADGKVAGPRGRRVQITNEQSTRLVHELRSRSDAILVGINTVLMDDPLLNARRVEPLRPMTRIVLDRKLQIRPASRLVQTALETRTLVYTSSRMTETDRARELIRAGVELRVAAESPAGLSLADVITDIGTLGATHLIVEPGPTLARSFLVRNSMLWDRAWVFRSLMRIDDPSATPAPPTPIGKVAELAIGTDQLTEYLNPASDAMFSPEPSADFLLATC